mgnify:CR=1 FL=1
MIVKTRRPYSARFAIPGVAAIDQLTPAELAALPQQSRDMVAAVYANAFYPVFLSMSGLIAIGLVAAVSLRNILLPTIRPKG